jgi:hypothetical protein
MLSAAARQETVTGSADGGTTVPFVLTLKQANCGTAAALRTTTQIIDEVFAQRNHFGQFTDGSLSGKPQYLRKKVLHTSFVCVCVRACNLDCTLDRKVCALLL